MSSTSTPRALCISYTNEYSIGHNSITDLTLGFERRIIASNSSRLNTARPGDLVFNASEPYHGVKMLMICRLTERADELANTWHLAGGKAWAYCWRVEVLLPPVPVTDALRSEIARLCGDSINPRIILNSRLCPYRAHTVAEGLVRHLVTA
jgi:hypothetical protein